MSERSASVRAGLVSTEPEVRRLATQEIPTLPAPESCELLVLALGDEDWRVRKEAASVAARVEPRTAVVFAVARALGDRDAIGLRNAAVEALIAIGPDAVPGAVDALSRLDADGRKLAVEVLAGAPTLAGMRALAAAIGDTDANVVAATVEALGQAHLAGDEARELAHAALTPLLVSRDTLVRLAVLGALRQLAVDVPWPALEPLFAEPLLRREAIAASGGSRHPRAIRALAQACADPSDTVSRDAVAALGRTLEEIWGEGHLVDIAADSLRGSPRAHARLRDLAQDPADSVARGAAILALGLVRDPADVSVLADALADDTVADQAGAALQLFGSEAVGPLIVAGSSAAPALRGATLSMLPQLAPQTSAPLVAVREALTDASPEVVASAIKSLAIVGGPSDLALVVRHAASSDPKVASAAHAAIHAIASRHHEAARALLAGIDPRSDMALCAAIILDALARASRVEPTDAAFLASALTHRDAATRRCAIEALASLGGEDAAEAITLSLIDEEDAVAHAAIRALGRLKRADHLAMLAASTRDPIRLASVIRALKDADHDRAFAAALPLLRSRDVVVAAAAVEVVGLIPLERRVDALLGATDHPEQEVAKLALSQLAKIGGERAFAALARAIEHDSEAVRRHAAELLGQEGGSEVEEVLRARLDRERSGDVRRAIMAALSVKPSEASA